MLCIPHSNNAQEGGWILQAQRSGLSYNVQPGEVALAIILSQQLVSGVILQGKGVWVPRSEIKAEAVEESPFCQQDPLLQAH